MSSVGIIVISILTRKLFIWCNVFNRYKVFPMVIVACIVGCIIVSRNNITIKRNELRKMTARLESAKNKYSNLEYVWSVKNKHQRLKKISSEKTTYLHMVDMHHVASLNNINNKIAQLAKTNKQDKPKTSGSSIHSSSICANQQKNNTIDDLLLRYIV